MPYKSPFPPFELPAVDLPGLFYESRKSTLPFPTDETITIDLETGESLSYNDIQSLAIPFARGLKANLGLKSKDVICVYSTNHVNASFTA
jgi:acyl-coenzyme A synthetase/AMP-(fatty) acid ligase